jgi:hypothetical protein
LEDAVEHHRIPSIRHDSRAAFHQRTHTCVSEHERERKQTHGPKFSAVPSAS